MCVFDMVEKALVGQPATDKLFFTNNGKWLRVRVRVAAETEGSAPVANNEKIIPQSVSLSVTIAKAYADGAVKVDHLGRLAISTAHEIVINHGGHGEFDQLQKVISDTVKERCRLFCVDLDQRKLVRQIIDGAWSSENKET
jgi:hypothetical protein